MQLSRGRIATALGLLTAELFVATGARAQEAKPEPAAISTAAPSALNDETESDLGKVRVDAAVLFYKEADGRVQAIEPMLGVTYSQLSGGVLSLRLISDTLTGATPIGAVPQRTPQIFQRGDSLTGASVPVTTRARALPLDPSFKDQRYAVDVGYSFLANTETRLSLGGGYSHERDFTSYSGRLGIARDFNDKNTTASLSLNLEHDLSRPLQGTPRALTPIGDPIRNGPDETKTIVGAVAGLTQVMSRSWLVQLNYSYGSTQGYQNDPYRLISVVDGRTGGQPQYLYEGRPRSRIRQSIYLGSKAAIGFNVLDVSARGYKDSWGVSSITLQAADRIALGSRFYAEPAIRFYRQWKADFFQYYLIRRTALPSYASADIRLGRFDAATLGLKLGLKFGRSNEFYVRGEFYKQYGDWRPAGAPGDLANQVLFPGVRATSIMAGYSFVFD